MKNIIYLIAIALCSIGMSAQDNKGTEFWMMFPGNLNTPSNLELYITGDVNTSGTVLIPGSSISLPFTVVAGNITSVNIPTSTQVTSSDLVTNQGIQIVANNEITVYGFSPPAFSTDAFLAFPTDAIGTDYIVLTYKNVNIVNGTQFGIVAAEAGTTTVTITPKVTTGIRTAGVPYNVNLTQGQTYMLRNTSSTGDLTGSIISANKKIAVFGSHQCSNIPSGSVVYCDYLVEQLPPNSAWGKEFVSVPLAGRPGGDTYRIIAQTAGTLVQIDGANVATLGVGQFYESVLTGYNSITASEPVLVGQYSNSGSFDSRPDTDPFFLLVPPTDQFLTTYTVNTGTPNIPNNFINIVSPSSQTSQVLVNGVSPGGTWTSISGTSFSGIQVPVGAGQQTISSSLPIGVFVYGFGTADSYGYLGGQSFSPVATVDSFSLGVTQTTATQAQEKCVVATVLDQNNDPVVGVLVNFTVSGANAGAAGFGTTNAQGQVTLCYNVCQAGNDTLIATIAGLADTVVIVVAPSTLGVMPASLNATAGVQSCVTATVLDGSNVPVMGAIVNFTVTGTNAATMVSVATNAMGEALFCYTPALAGNDMINISAGCTGGNTATVGVTVAGSGQPCINPATVTITAAGLNALWSNQGANDPYTFYYGIVDAKRLNARVVGGVGPFTYTWSNSGTPAMLPRPYYPANSIDLYRPTAATTVTVSVFDQGNGCTYTGTVNIGWEGKYFCQVVNSTWYLYVCQNGQKVCVTWNVGRALLQSNQASLSGCVLKTETQLVAGTLSLYPNPSKGLLNLGTYIAKAGEGSLMVMDMRGNTIHAEALNFAEGMWEQSLELNHLASGTYIIRLQTADNVITERFQIIN